MIGLLALPMALRNRATEFIFRRENDRLPNLRLYETVVYRLRHRPRAWIFTFDKVFTTCFLKSPDYRLRSAGWGGVNSISMNGNNHEVVLALSLLWNR